MMNIRHPMKNERDLVRELVDNVGAVEILRILAGIIGHDHPSIETGGAYKSALFKIAGQISNEPDPDNSAAIPSPILRKTHMELIQKAIERFEAIQDKYIRNGAGDSEPDGVFHRIICRAATERDPKIPDTVEGWQIYSGQSGSPVAANELTEASRHVAAAIKTAYDESRTAEFKEIRTYLENYTWRIDWPA